jgi:hypothetical protein
MKRSFALRTMLGTLLLGGFACAAGAPFELRVSNALAPGLLLAIADELDQDTVVLGFVDRRVTLAAEFTSPHEIARAVSSQLGAGLARERDTLLVTPDCRRQPVVDSVLSSSPALVSLSFQRISPSAIAALLADLHNLPLQDADNGKPQQAVAVRLKNRRSSDVAALVASVSQVSLRKLQTEYVVQAPDVAQLCTETLGLGSNVTEWDRLAAERIARRCPSPPAGLSRPSSGADWCMPLELYELDELRLRGYVRTPKRPLVLLESFDGMTFAVGVGDYVGRRFGKVLSVSPDGLVVRELRQGLSGELYWARTRISADGSRKSLPDAE